MQDKQLQFLLTPPDFAPQENAAQSGGDGDGGLFFQQVQQRSLPLVRLRLRLMQLDLYVLLSSVVRVNGSRCWTDRRCVLCRTVWWGTVGSHRGEVLEKPTQAPPSPSEGHRL